MEQDMCRRSLFIFSFKIIAVRLILAASILLGYIHHVLPQYGQGYNASLIDKAERLKSVSSPKMVLLGNSNLSFGLESSLLQTRFGMPVINMGLHGGAGNAFHEEMAKIKVEKDDIYIVCHTDFADYDTMEDAMVVWTALENNYSLWNLLRWKDMRRMAEGFPVYLKKCLNLYALNTGNADVGGVYSRKAFNEYGDIEVYREGNINVQQNDVRVPEIDEITVNRLNELNAYLQKRGAVMLVAAYPIANGEMTADAEEFISFQKELARRLDCAVISNYVDYMIDYSYFYEPLFHLDSTGARLRTEQLIKDLERWREAPDRYKDADMSRDIYEDILSDAMLSHITDFHKYLSALKKAGDRYCVFLSMKETVSGSMDDTDKRMLKDLGVGAAVHNPQKGYIAVSDCGRVTEKKDDNLLELSGRLDSGPVYHMTSIRNDHGMDCSIILDGREYSKNQKGINMIVYSRETGRVLDSVSFDICLGEMRSVRNIE